MRGIGKAVRLAAAVIATFGAAAPARADFHPACTGPSAAASMKAEAGEFVYTGDVRCGNARQISVSDVVLTNYLGPLALGTVTAPGQTCTADLTTDPVTYCDRVTVTGRTPAPLLAGYYRVAFTFTVVNHDGTRTFRNVRRSAAYMWNGTALRSCAQTNPPPGC